ncbi:uncharacterized protein LOC120413610 [Culex pipiens pallens]|uniref:uncharacterized protein LOC120413610 n=1 Tax=Culex pipiens pallens TaxID=42434 RepID=UPI0019535ACC|nr:uncharacterized protein LOC120413610 [Culex pipiens pallens]
MKLLGRALVLTLLAVIVSCDGQQKQQQQQQITDNAGGSAASSDGKAAAGGSSGAAGDRPQYNKRGAPEIQTIVGTPQHAYINQPGVAGGAAATGTPSIAALGPAAAVAYATYAHPQHQQQHQQLVQASSISSPQTIYHKINYVAPGSTLKVATYAAAAPAHYEYAAAVPGLTKYQYAAAAAYPQYQYAAYPQQHQIQHQQQQQQQPQYQVYQHHQTVQLPAASAIISTAPHPHQTVATLPAHQIQPGTTIYAAHQPAAFHYTLTQPAQQQHNYQQQQSAGHAGTFTYHQAVPVVHQAPIAAIGQVHHHQQQQQQQQQVVANQYPVVPTAASPLYATASTSPNQFYHQPTNYAAYPVPLAAKQIVSTVPAPTIPTPAHHQHHLKQLIPVTTATTTHHHGKGISYATFTQQANPASLGHLQQHYLQQQQHQQQQQQQQPRYQVYSTVATPQKQTLVYGPAGQSSIPAAIYATAPTHLQLAAFQQHQQQQQQQQSVHYGTHLFQQQLAQYQQQQPAYVAPLAKINYGQAQAVALQKGGGYYHQVQ